MILSEHFTLDELTHSDEAIQHHIVNQPNEDETKNLTTLCLNVLEPLRLIIGKPIDVDSGFRNEELNKLVGGVPASQHRLGEAADCTVIGLEPEQVVHILLTSEIDFDEAIAEHDLTENTHWTHISHTSRRLNRRKASRAIREKGTTTYFPWDKR